MIKTIELILVTILLIFSFFAGVKYSESVKSHASWLFESKEEEVELPDLSGENNVEISVPGEGAAESAPAQAPQDVVGEESSSDAGQASSVAAPTAN